MRMIGEKLRNCNNPASGNGVYEEHGLFLFPNTDAGWLATVGCLCMDSLKHAQAVQFHENSYKIGMRVAQGHSMVFTHHQDPWFHQH